eukprot:733125_1
MIVLWLWDMLALIFILLVSVAYLIYKTIDESQIQNLFDQEPVPSGDPRPPAGAFSDYSLLTSEKDLENDATLSTDNLDGELKRVADENGDFLCALWEISEFVIRDFIDSWWKDVAPDTTCFADEVRQRFRFIFTTLINRGRRVNWRRFAAKRVLGGLTQLFRIQRLARRALCALDKQFEDRPEDERLELLKQEILRSYKLHEATDPSRRAEYLRKLSEIVLREVLPIDDFRCSLVRVLARELLANNVLDVALSFAEPYWVNVGLVMFLSPEFWDQAESEIPDGEDDVGMRMMSASTELPPDPQKSTRLERSHSLNLDSARQSSGEPDPAFQTQSPQNDPGSASQRLSKQLLIEGHVKVIISTAAIQFERKSHHPYTIYRLEVLQNGSRLWSVGKRFSDFVKVHNSLKKYVSRLNAQLPEKKVLNNLKPRFIEMRKTSLQTYLDSLMMNKDVLENYQFAAFLTPNSSSSTSIPEKSSRLNHLRRSRQIFHKMRRAFGRRTRTRSESEGEARGQLSSTESDRRVRSVSVDAVLSDTHNTCQSSSNISLNSAESESHLSGNESDSESDNLTSLSDSEPRKTGSERFSVESENGVCRLSDPGLPQSRIPTLRRRLCRDNSLPPISSKYTKRRRKRRSMFKKTSSLTKPLYRFVEEVFVFTPGAWLGANAAWIASRVAELIFDGFVERWYNERVDSFVTDQSSVRVIRYITSLIWPDGKLAEPSPPPTEAEMAKLRSESFECLLRCAPKKIVSVVGNSVFEKGVRRIWEFCQIKIFVEHLAFTLLDAVVQEIFPQTRKSNKKREINKNPK